MKHIRWLTFFKVFKGKVTYTFLVCGQDINTYDISVHGHKYGNDQRPGLEEISLNINF